MNIDKVKNIILQSKHAHEEATCLSGQGKDFEKGYIQAHKDIIETLEAVFDKKSKKEGR